MSFLKPPRCDRAWAALFLPASFLVAGACSLSAPDRSAIVGRTPPGAAGAASSGSGGGGQGGGGGIHAGGKGGASYDWGTAEVLLREGPVEEKNAIPACAVGGTAQRFFASTTRKPFDTASDLQRGECGACSCGAAGGPSGCRFPELFDPLCNIAAGCTSEDGSCRTEVRYGGCLRYPLRQPGAEGPGADPAERYDSDKAHIACGTPQPGAYTPPLIVDRQLDVCAVPDGDFPSCPPGGCRPHEGDLLCRRLGGETACPQSYPLLRVAFASVTTPGVVTCPCDCVSDHTSCVGSVTAYTGEGCGGMPTSASGDGCLPKEEAFQSHQSAVTGGAPGACLPVVPSPTPAGEYRRQSITTFCCRMP